MLTYQKKKKSINCAYHSKKLSMYMYDVMIYIFLLLFYKVVASKIPDWMGQICIYTSGFNVSLWWWIFILWYAHSDFMRNRKYEFWIYQPCFMLRNLVYLEHEFAGICDSTCFWLWSCYSFHLFPFLSKRDHESYWLGGNCCGWDWHHR